MSVFTDREMIKNEIIRFSVGFHVQHPDEEVKVEMMEVAATIIANKTRESGDYESAALFDLAVEKFPSITWMHIATEVAKLTGKKHIFVNNERVPLSSKKQGGSLNTHIPNKVERKPLSEKTFFAFVGFVLLVSIAMLFFKYQ